MHNQQAICNCQENPTGIIVPIYRHIYWQNVFSFLDIDGKDSFKLYNTTYHKWVWHGCGRATGEWKRLIKYYKEMQCSWKTMDWEPRNQICSNVTMLLKTIHLAYPSSFYLTCNIKVFNTRVLSHLYWLYHVSSHVIRVSWHVFVFKFIIS